MSLYTFNISGCDTKEEIIEQLKIVIDTLNESDEVDIDNALIKAKITKDLFEDIESLPQELQAILNKYSEMDNDYHNCAKMLKEVEAIGYTFEYGLDAEPYGLSKIN